MTAGRLRGGNRDDAPGRDAADTDPGGAPPACPFCGSADTELFSLFGSSPLTSQYYCRACRTAFEQVKWGTPPPAPAGGRGS